MTFELMQWVLAIGLLILWLTKPGGLFERLEVVRKISE